jgi:hypothetical protein
MTRATFAARATFQARAALHRFGSQVATVYALIPRIPIKHHDRNGVKLKNLEATVPESFVNPQNVPSSYRCIAALAGLRTLTQLRERPEL